MPPNFAKLKWMCVALTTVGLVDFVGFSHEHGSRGRSKSSCQAGKQILKLQHRNLHVSPPFTVQQYDSLVQTRMDDESVELGVPPQYQRPLVGSRLSKELGRDPSRETFLKRVETRLALRSPSVPLDFVQLLCPRRILWQFLRWTACDPELASNALPWKRRLRKYYSNEPGVLGHWHENRVLGLDCLVLHSPPVSGWWDQWNNYGRAFERMATPGRDKADAYYHEVVKFSLGKLRTAVYHEIDAMKDGAPVELKTLSPRNFQEFETDRMIDACFQMILSGTKTLCIGVVDRDSGYLIEVKELFVDEMSAALGKLGVQPADLLGRLATAMDKIWEACSKYPSGSFEFLMDEEYIYLNVVGQV
eukprot:Skav223362  [mRNA]  locus=scaffold200:565372:566454:+ [translate_table: standard]